MAIDSIVNLDELRQAMGAKSGASVAVEGDTGWRADTPGQYPLAMINSVKRAAQGKPAMVGKVGKAVPTWLRLLPGNCSLERPSPGSHLRGGQQRGAGRREPMPACVGMNLSRSQIEFARSCHPAFSTLRVAHISAADIHGQRQGASHS